MYTWAEKYVKYERPQKRAAQGMTREWHHMLAGSNYAAGGKNVSAVSLQFSKGPVMSELFYCLAIHPQ